MATSPVNTFRKCNGYQLMKMHKPDIMPKVWNTRPPGESWSCTISLTVAGKYP